METTELNLESGSFVAALEQVLPRYGYRSMRSFDLRLTDDASQVPLLEQSCRCGCGFTVILVYATTPRSGIEGTISVRGIAERSIVSLTAPDYEGSLESQFPTIWVETMQMQASDREGERGRLCRCAQA